MRTSRRQRVAVALAVIVPTLSACADAPVTTPLPVYSGVTLSVAPDVELAAFMDALNAQLAAQGVDYRAAVAEYIAPGDSGQAGGTVLSKVVGNKQLPHDFVPLDPRRAGWSGTPGPGDNMTFAIDETGDAVPPLGGLTGAQTTAAILAAMATWEGVSCSTLPLAQNPTFGLDVGLVAFLNGLGGSPFVFADVQHAGWRDINFAGGILGVTFTFVFVDGGGVPTDIDGNGVADAAFREIYYDPSFSWANNGVANIDVQSVAVHEAGHGLSQGHFGKVWFKNDGSLKASPRAVMNALYAGPFRDLAGSDNGGHCSNWASWPNN
ncbi:MAG: hypothetical protein ACT4P6_03080 [Gemmatimonadaceae bacterium]